MKLKGFPVIIIALLLCIVFSFVGCNNTIQDEPKTGEYNEDVSNGVNSVCTSFKNVTGVTGASAIYISLKGSSSTTDSSLSSNDYPTEFSLTARINISEENQQKDTLSVLSLTVTRQTSSGAIKSLMEIYYKEGVLYINYPPVFSRVAIKDFNLARIASILYNSKQESNGKLYEISNLIPSFLEDIFDKLTVNESDSLTTYYFSVNYNAIYDSLKNLISSTDIGIDVDEFLSIFSLNSKSFEELSTGEGTVEINTVTKRAEQLFSTASYTYKKDTVERVIDINEFKITAYEESMDLTAYPVILAENLSAYTPYDFSNLRLEGDMTIAFSSTNGLSSSILGMDTTLDLSMAEYPCQFEIITNNSENGYEGFLRLYNIGKSQKGISVYIKDNVIYLNLSDIIGKKDTDNGYISLTTEKLSSSLKSLGIITDSEEITPLEIAGAVGRLLSKLDSNENYTNIYLDNELLTLIVSGIGYKPIMNWNKLVLKLNTESSSFKGISADLSTAGITVNLSALEPSIGAENSVNEPDWKEKCKAIDEDILLTPVLEGEISTNLTGIKNNKLVEELIYSLTGSEITLNNDNSIYSFKASANCSYSGKLSFFRLDFLDSNGRIICTLYYNNKGDEGKYLYVVQTIDGLDVVDKLELLSSSRYGEFAHFVHGNSLVQDSSQNIGITNNSDEITFKLNQSGLNALLEKIKAILPDFFIESVPQELGISTLSFKMGNPEIKATFGNGKYISLTISSFTIGYESLAVKTVEVTPATSRVSIYDNNNLPERLDILVGTDEGDKKMSVLAESFGGWYCDNPPEIGTGETQVDCYVKVFGQKVYTSVIVDCTEATDVKVVENTAYSKYSNGYQFEFDRYQTEVDPFDVINNRFNKVYVIANTQYTKSVVWYYGNGSGNKILSEDCYKNNNDISYLITPAVTDFFGREQRFKSKQFEIVLNGDKVEKIKDKDNFYTISAFTGDNPLNPSTYNNRNNLEGDRTIYLVTSNEEAIVFDRLDWNLSTIKNSTIALDGKKLSDSELKSKLQEELYKLDGDFKISANICDCLGTATSLEATITVKSKLIEKIDLADISYGLLATTQQVEDEDKIYYGLIAIDPMQLRKIDSATALTKSVLVKFKNDDDVQSLSTIKWELPSLELSLYSSTPEDGDIVLKIGDSISGYQSFTFKYIVINYQLKEISIGEFNGKTFEALSTIDKELITDGKLSPSIAFNLEDLDPYAKTYPDAINAIKLTYGEFNYDKYSDFTYTLKEGTIITTIDWNFDNWNESTLWQDSDKIYSASCSIADLTINLSMKFLERTVADWYFPSIGDGEQSAYLVATPNKKEGAIPSYEKNDNGEYVLKNGMFVKAESGESNIQRYSLVGNGTYNVYYAKPNENDVYRIILDPNAVDYLDKDCYPAKAYVKFDGDEDYVLVDIIWDISPLEESSSIQENGFYGKLTVSLAYSQRMAEVDLWIAGSYPDNYFADPYFEEYEEGGKTDQRFVLESSKNSIELSLISLQNGSVKINDLFSESGIHSAICGCSDASCKGWIYFYYKNSTVESGMFPVSEWLGLEQIEKLYNDALARGTAIEDISGMVTLQAKVGDLILNVPVQINASTLVNLKLSGVPHVNNSIYSSLSGAVYTIDNKLYYEVDPYLTSVLEQSFYPTTLEFTYKGQNVSVKIDYWDCSQFDNVNLYEGAVKTAYACFNTEMGASISIPVTVTVISRVIESVSVDNNTIKSINVNCYSSSPFGENVAWENDRLIAYKSVSVKFVNDDHLYPLTMKYDVTDLSVSYAGGLIASDITVFIGNDAGGYQELSGYSVYSSQKIVLRGYSEAVKNAKDTVVKLSSGTENTLENLLTANEKDNCSNILKGIIYSYNEFVPSFTDFTIAEGDSEAVKLLKAKAWEALIVSSQEIQFRVGYVAVGEANTANYVYEELSASEYYNNVYGLCYRWIRDDNNIVKLELFNVIQGLEKLLGEAQVINTGNASYASLTDNMFNYSKSDKEYSPSYTVAQYLEELNLKPATSSSKLFTIEDIAISVFDNYNREISLDSVLTVGSYTVKASVNTCKFDGAITINFEITSRIIDDVKVICGNSTVNKNTITQNAGTSLNVYAIAYWETEFDHKIEIEVDVRFYDQEGILLLPDESGFYEFSDIPGTYTIKFFAVDSNYKLNRDDITLILNEVK